MLKIVENTWNVWENMGMELEHTTNTLLDIKVSGKPH